MMMDLQDMELGRDWTDRPQERDKRLAIVDTIVNLRVP